MPCGNGFVSLANKTNNGPPVDVLRPLDFVVAAATAEVGKLNIWALASPCPSRKKHNQTIQNKIKNIFCTSLISTLLLFELPSEPGSSL